VNANKLDKSLTELMPVWRRFARGLVKSSVNGDDLLQETLLKCMENQGAKMHQLAESGHLFTYVNRCLYTMAIDSSSRYGMKYRKFATGWDTFSTQHEREPEQPWLGSRIDNEYLDAYISLMPDIDAIMLRLYIMDDFSYQKVSEHTGIPIKYLYKRVEKAIKKIRTNVTKRPSCYKDEEV
jgi:RNA polymerase sigma factor (sigma-70 family)